LVASGGGAIAPPWIKSQYTVPKDSELGNNAIRSDVNIIETENRMDIESTN